MTSNSSGRKGAVSLGVANSRFIGGQPPNAPVDASATVPPDRGLAEKQPRWRRDFPIDWAEADYVSRRDLIKYVVLTSGAFAVGQAFIVWKTLSAKARSLYPRSLIAAVDELPVGGAKTFIYPEGSTPRLLIRTGLDDFVAYDQQCTHLQCPVVPKVEEGKIHCPCHNGWFDLTTGAPTAGPPRRPLPRVLLEIEDETVYAVGMETKTL